MLIVTYDFKIVVHVVGLKEFNWCVETAVNTMNFVKRHSQL